jgi:glycosyltransferase involved in cell wall biosynthesis
MENMGGTGGGQKKSDIEPGAPDPTVSSLTELARIVPKLARIGSQRPRPLVSVSMLTYRHEKYIKEAILGVLMQETNFQIEAVISNDHSPDDTDAIIRSVIHNHPRADRIRYIRHEQNLGIMANALDNLKKCQGAYLAFCEGDDCWTDPLKLQKQVDELQQNPTSDLCFHPAQTFYGQQPTTELFGLQAFRKKRISPYEVIAGGGDFCPTASVVIRKEIFEKLKDFLKTTPIGDYFLQAVGSLRGGAIYLPQPMCIYRKGTPFSWTTDMQSLENRENFFWLIFDSLKRFDGFLSHSNSQPLNIEIERQYLHLSLTYLKQGLIEKYQTLFKEFAKRHPISPRIAILHAVGLQLQSESFTRELDRWCFAKPNTLSRALRRCAKTLSQFEHSCRLHTQRNSQAQVGSVNTK